MNYFIFLTLLLFSIISSADVTFKVDSVKEKDLPILQSQTNIAVANKFEGKIEAYKIPHEKISISEINGFIHTVKLAYDNHLKLEISPDDIWLLICQGLAIHINENYNSMKPLILKNQNQESKILLKVRRDDFIKGQSNPWDEVVAEFAKQIDKNTKDELLKLFTPDFTTTTADKKVVFEMTLMKTTDCYFEYQCDTLCGIPEIALKGSPEDWMKLKENIAAINKYKLEWWTKELNPVIDEFIIASKGTPNIAFWKRILKAKEGSGEPLRISGWIIKFFPYLASNADKFYKNQHIDKSNPIGLKANMFPKGITHVNFKWNYLGEELQMELCSGFIGANIDDKKVVCTAIGWVIKEYNLPPIITGIKGKNAGMILFYCCLAIICLTLISSCLYLGFTEKIWRRKFTGIGIYLGTKTSVFILAILICDFCYEYFLKTSDFTISLDFMLTNIVSLLFKDYVSLTELTMKCIISMSILVFSLFPCKNIRLNILLTVLGWILWILYSLHIFKSTF